jgi:membrane-associated HD superfamily phosphohydrolase
MIISSSTADTIYLSASALTVIFGVSTAALAIRKYHRPRESKFDVLTLWATVVTTALATVVFFIGNIRDNYSDLRISVMTQPNLLTLCG